MRDFLLRLNRRKMWLNSLVYLVIFALHQISPRMEGLLGDAVRLYLVVFPVFFLAWLLATHHGRRERR